MLIIPAIDLKDGCVVRLTQGSLKEKKVYSRDAVKTAKHWLRQGAELIHVVDLDGATTGEPKNIEIAKQIVKATSAPIEFGGGIRSIEAIKSLIDAGAMRVVLGTKAIEDRAFLKKAFKQFKDKVIVSIDSRGGKVLVKGWLKESNKLETITLAKELKALGFKEIIYTDISKDGTLKGPDIKGIKALLKATGLKVIASGGVSCLDDIRKLKTLEKKGISGVIIGKALYEAKFTLTQALKLS